MPRTAAGQVPGDAAGPGKATQAARAAREQAAMAPASTGAAVAAALRQHWLITVLVVAGLALRAATSIAYRPALLYIDTMKYLYNAWPGADPVGYKGPLGAILLVGNLDAVAAVQHLLGIGMGVTIYLLLTRRGVPHWLAALAAAPVLLDSYQLQMEQTIMPDVWFEALIVAGLAVLAWRTRPGPRVIVAAGLLLGLSTTMRQVGEILIVPALAYVLVTAVGGGFRSMAYRSAALVVAFLVPILGYCTVSYAATGHFWLSRNGASATYGRMAGAADCATLRLPGYERALCPTPDQQAQGRDWLDHSAASPLKLYVQPPGASRKHIVNSFDNAVATQQPLRVAGAVLGDAAKLFAVVRVTMPGDTPISRWQFHDSYPVFPPVTSLTGRGTIVLGLRLLPAGGPVVYKPLPSSLGGRAEAVRPLAGLLRSYQLHGGYAPGPMLALDALAGLAGSLAAFRSGRPARQAAQDHQQVPAGRAIAACCLLFFTTALCVLVMSDLFEFSWRYQLPALVTLPPAGALGLTVIARAIAARRRAGRALTASHDAGTG